MLDDSTGLFRAYNNLDENGSFVYGNTLYSRGSIPPGRIFSNPGGVFRDWLHDDVLLGLQVFGKAAGDWGVRHTYKYADQKRTLAAMPQVNRIVTHSLSARTALTIDDENPGRYDVQAYSTPILSPHIPYLNDKADPRRVKGWVDPVSMLDENAGTVIPTTTFNLHSYDQLGKGKFSPYYGRDTGFADGYQNADGSLSLFR